MVKQQRQCLQSNHLHETTDNTSTKDSKWQHSVTMTKTLFQPKKKKKQKQTFVEVGIKGQVERTYQQWRLSGTASPLLTYSTVSVLPVWWKGKETNQTQQLLMKNNKSKLLSSLGEVIMKL